MLRSILYLGLKEGIVAGPNIAGHFLYGIIVLS